MDKQHILVVDDNHINRLFFESSLKKLGYQVTSAEDGYQALTLCDQYKFQLILMDIRMNGLDGIQTAHKIKQLEAYQDTIILAISAEGFDHQKHPVFESSLLKPIKIDCLKESLDKFLGVNEIFNNQLALKISHNDEEIVQKLRGLLIDQLPEEKNKLENSFVANNWRAIDDQLHQLLGSTKVCAATFLFKQIESTKEILGNNGHIKVSEFNALKNAIDQTINFSQIG